MTDIDYIEYRVFWRPILGKDNGKTFKMPVGAIVLGITKSGGKNNLVIAVPIGIGKAGALTEVIP